VKGWTMRTSQTRGGGRWETVTGMCKKGGQPRKIIQKKSRREVYGEWGGGTIVGFVNTNQRDQKQNPEPTGKKRKKGWATTIRRKRGGCRFDVRKIPSVV